MGLAVLTALCVGGATIMGAGIGFLFKKISLRFSNIILSFAAGVMLSAAVYGLISPSLGEGGITAATVSVAGIFFGAWVIWIIEWLVEYMGRHEEGCLDQKSRAQRRVMIFVVAIIVHNLPEGIAAGIGFGTGDISQAFTVAGGIALQNIPEGMVIIGPMTAAGIPPGKTLFWAMMSGSVEIFGTLLGYFAVSLATALLPFALAFAGGTMIYIIIDEMIPETNGDNGKKTSWALMTGFCVTLIFNGLMG